jgi:hypothetical protein
MNSMANLKITVNSSNLIKKLEQLEKDLNNLPKETYQEFKKNTPIKSGNAKRSTKLKGNTISADYPYAGVLDKGRHMTNRGMRGSDQAPEGMTKPTLKFLQKRIKQITKGF